MKYSRRSLPLFLLLLVVSAAPAQLPPPCTTFDNNTLNGWTLQNTTANVLTVTGHPTPVVDLRDQANASNFIAPASYHGNWLTLSGGCGQLCFQVNVINDGLPTSGPVTPSFTIVSGPNRAFFRTNGIVEGSGWHNVCAPIGPLDSNGNLPSNGQGTWTLASGSWPSLITNVQSMQFAVDFAGSSAQTEHLLLDNICFRPASCAKADFAVKNICAGEQASYVNQSTGATSSSWSFPGGNPASSTAASPTVTYPTPGTFAATLCINGGTAAPLCVTKNIIVHPRPPAPVITGPNTACQKPATYCVTPQPGITYSWAIVPPAAGTIVSTTATCATVNWNAPGGGVIVATATSAQGCKTSSRMEVKPCPVSPCCPQPSFTVTSARLVRVGPSWVFRPVISAPSARRVVIQIIRASTTNTVGACPSVPAFAPVVTAVGAASPAVPLTPGQTVPGSFDAFWQGNAAVALANVTFPMTVQVPNLGPACADTVNLCVKYTISDGECRTCERIECYSFRRSNIIDDPTVSTTTVVN